MTQPYKVGYLMRANEGIYSVIRDEMPSGWTLVTANNGTSPVETMRDLDVVIGGKITSEMIEAAPKLKLIMTPGVGYDGVDLKAAAARNIPVAVTICGNTTEVAEYTMMLMLAVSRRLTELDASMRNGQWLMWDRRLQSMNLAGKTLGLIGFGRIGKAVAKRAEAFEMTVQYFDPITPDSIPLEQLLSTSDYVSLHVPLTAGTRNLLNADRIRQMKSGSVVINTARGEAVDELALIEALRSGYLAGAGLDVFAKEPPEKDNPLFSMPNVVVSPHIASGTRDGLRIKAKQYAKNIELIMAGKEPIDCLALPGSSN